MNEVPRTAVINSHQFLRKAIFSSTELDPEAECHRPVIVSNMHQPLGRILDRFTVRPEHGDDDVIDEDLILVWTAAEERIIAVRIFWAACCTGSAGSTVPKQIGVGRTLFP